MDNGKQSSVLVSGHLVLSFVPLASTRNALKHLVRLGTISHMADIWARQTKERFQGSVLGEQECAVSLFAALRVALVALTNEESREYLALSEFRDLLQRVSGPMWHQALSCIKGEGVSLQDAAVICTAFRDMMGQELEDAGLMGFDQSRLLMLLFDWVLEQIYELWQSKPEVHQRASSSSSLDIEDLRAIVESVRSPVDLKPVLRTIVDQVRDSGLWPMCAIGIIDQDDQEIAVPAQSGFAESYPANAKFPASGSATLEAVRRGKPIAISDVFSNGEFPVLPEAAKTAGYRSILLVPLIIEELRAVVAFCSQEPHEFTDHEIALATAIAQQVMIALENAHRYEREKQRVGELESLNRLIAEQNRLLQRAAETHTALTRLVLDDAGMKRILEAVRELLGNPVAIENEFFHLLGFSDDWKHFDQHRRDSIAAGGTAPEVFSNPETAAVLDDIHRNRRAVLMPTLPAIGIEKRRIVAPIIAGGDILGYVWVMEALRSFEEQDLITGEQAALVLALEMMKQRATFETELRLKADFLDDLLFPNSARESELLQRASFLGYSFGKQSLLLVVDIDGGIWGSVYNGQQHDRQIILGVQGAVARHAPENLVANQAGRILVIVPVPDHRTDSWPFASRLASDIRSGLKRINADLQVLVGVGGVCQRISEVRSAYLQACRALDAAQGLGRVDETLRLSDLGIYSILFRDDNDELLAFAEKGLAPLIEYDWSNGTDLLKTLDAYLTHQGRLAETARRLYIHVNTLRQRLQRVEDVLSVSLSDPLARLNLQLALRVHEVAADRTATE